MKVFHSTRTGEDGISRSVRQEGRMVVRDENKEGVGIRRVCGKAGASGTEGGQLIDTRAVTQWERLELAVLKEIDQNSKSVGKKMGKGAWKRRAR